MAEKPEEKNISDNELDSLKEEIQDLKKKKEIEELKAEVDSLKTENETTKKKKEIKSLQAEVDSLNSPTYKYSDPSWDEIKSKRTTTGIVGIFLGFLGVHKFMLGYNAEGFILLAISVVGGIITCGFSIIITDIIGIIEGIIILTKTPEEFKRLYIDKKTGWF